jgi:hypothetical protein
MGAITKAHTRYYVKEKQVPGVSTIIGDTLGWNKGALVGWARKEALRGNDPNKVKDLAGEIGTLCHYLISCDLVGAYPDLSDYSPNVIDKAENSLIKYWDWRKGKKIEPLMVEKPLVSEIYKFGGTPDFFGIVDNKSTWMDYKSGSGIYPEMIIQAAAYNHLIRSVMSQPDDLCPEEWIILNIPKDDKTGFTERKLTTSEIEAGWEIFTHLLAIYQLKDRIK